MFNLKLKNSDKDLLQLLPKEFSEELLRIGKEGDVKYLLRDVVLKGLIENRPLDGIERGIAELERFKDQLMEDFGRVANEHLSLAGMNSSIKLTCSELYKDNQALSMKLSGLRAQNRGLASILGIEENVDPRDAEMIERYVLGSIRNK